ncbi:hypothetical protein [Limnohabitans sp.]|uniref:hypothetical protein n=1 Tax=Limnohabitans sp. TaxID=1907725 RepID=UPI0031FD27ED
MKIKIFLIFSLFYSAQALAGVVQCRPSTVNPEILSISLDATQNKAILVLGNGDIKEGTITGIRDHATEKDRVGKKINATFKFKDDIFKTDEIELIIFPAFGSLRYIGARYNIKESQKLLNSIITGRELICKE